VYKQLTYKIADWFGLSNFKRIKKLELERAALTAFRDRIEGTLKRADNYPMEILIKCAHADMKIGFINERINQLSHTAVVCCILGAGRDEAVAGGRRGMGNVGGVTRKADTPCDPDCASRTTDSFLSASTLYYRQLLCLEFCAS
jgi:hypothetical protein